MTRLFNFSEDDANRIKEIERTTNHNIKAVEYFLKEQIAHIDELKNAGRIHSLACTSEDINNLSHALMLKNGREVLVAMQQIIDSIVALAEQHADGQYCIRTHGQTASQQLGERNGEHDSALHVDQTIQTS